MTTAPQRDEDCPFHDLPPAETVWFKLGHIAMPVSAERGCVMFHETLAIQRLLFEDVA